MSRRAASEIRESLVGRWALSSPHPTARELAAQFGVSYEVARRAVAQARTSIGISTTPTEVERDMSRLRAEAKQLREDLDAVLRTNSILNERLGRSGAS